MCFFNKRAIVLFTKSFFLLGKIKSIICLLYFSTNTNKTEELNLDTMKSPSQCPYSRRAVYGLVPIHFLSGSFKNLSFFLLRPDFILFLSQNKNLSSPGLRSMNFLIDFGLAYFKPD